MHSCQEQIEVYRSYKSHLLPSLACIFSVQHKWRALESTTRNLGVWHLNVINLMERGKNESHSDNAD
jgi:hypothetical protein